MSQRRRDDDHAIARIAELEAEIAERDAIVSAEDVALAERDAEIARLERRLGRARMLAEWPPSAIADRGSRGVRVAIVGLVAGAGLVAGLLAPSPPRRAPSAVAAPAAARAPLLADPAPPLEPEPRARVVDDGPRGETLASYREALRRAPDDADLGLRVGATLVMAGRPAEAVEIPRAGAESAPEARTESELVATASRRILEQTEWSSLEAQSPRAGSDHVPQNVAVTRSSGRGAAA